jgi:nitrite reductase (NADH) large subunit
LLGQSAQFVAKELSTKLKVTGCDLFSAGDFSDGDDRDSIVFHDKVRRVYKRLVIKDSRLIGAVLYGDTADGAWFYKHITDGTDVASLRDQLIFGPAFDADRTQLPQSAITSDIARPASISMTQESLQ